MKAINDIIKTERDRLFVVAPECYIIFTGDSLSDQRPFIRIGNTHDLPAEVIPLIENIVITDIPVGNPALEQFNINVNYLSGNRYIGSKFIAKSYLELQKAYNLDLGKVTILDVEKDTPQLIRQKKIKDRKSYIGIFYADGNFQLSHEDNALFDLAKANDYYYTENRINSLLTEQFKNTRRYAGAGFILMDAYTLFYKNGYFSSYEPPLNYYDDFCKLQVDQSRIREILFPHSNVLNALPIIKWKNNNRRVLKVFDDNKERVSLLQKIYVNCKMNTQMFHGMSYNTGEGLIFDVDKKSSNMLLQYTTLLPGRDTLHVGYVNDYQHGFVFDAGPDLIVITNEIFTNIEELIRDNTVPLLIQVDKTFKGKYNTRYDYVYPGVQYELKSYTGHNKLSRDLAAAVTDKKLSEVLKELSPKTVKALKKALPSVKRSGLNELLDVNNCKQLLKVEAGQAGRSAYRHKLEKLIKFIDKKYSEKELVADHAFSFMITLCYCAGTVSKLYKPVALSSAIPSHIFDDFNENNLDLAKNYKDPVLYESYKQILEDRERLMRLLALYYNKGTGIKKNATDLRKAIDVRRKQYTKTVKKKKAVKKDKRDVKVQLRSIRMKKVRKFFTWLFLLLLLAFLGYGGYYGYHQYEKYREAKLEEKRRLEEQKRLAEEKRRKEEEAVRVREESRRLIKKYNIRVSDYDIYVYANKVALKNGYARIELKNIRKNNPNWIYPGNVFILLDGEKVTVVRGNTLWGISERKLIEQQIGFYTILEKIKNNIEDPANSDRIRKARKLAFAKRHYKDLKQVETQLKK